MHSTNFFLGGDMKIIEQWVSFILNGQGISYIIISSKWLFPCAPALHITGNVFNLLKLLKEQSYFFLFHSLFSCHLSAVIQFNFIPLCYLPACPALPYF